ncbi:unnamed protein product [Peniophora sp. CBMAI 1063]|nr:unnamed protein product [Peniophora sp. CBMAI 1063]
MSVPGSTHYDGVRVAAAVGIVTSSILSGAFLSSSSSAIPALLTTSHPSSTSATSTTPLPLLRAFARFYARGETAMPPLAALSSVAYAYAALNVSNARFVTKGSFGAAHRSFLFAAASVLTIGVLPYTFFVMLGGIEKLVKGSEDEVEAKRVGGERAVRGVEAWRAQNWVRGVMGVVGSVCGVWASFA